MKPIRSDAFNSTPYDFGWKVRDSWLGNVDSGLNPVRDEIIPYMEIEAARILRATETIIGCQDEPNRLQDPEAWRRWWMNEAHHLSTHYGSTPDADYSLPDVSRHAINVLNSASELRVAMASNDVERTALFTALLTMEALQGGYCLDLEAAKEALDKREQDGIGKINSSYKTVEKACVKLAKQLWNENPSQRIGEVVQTILDRIFTAKANGNEIPVPKDETIKGWLIEAEKNKKLTIPSGARKGGRPKKTK